VSEQTAPPRVLVVMGIEHIAETYEQTLQDEYEVDTATGVAEALDVIGEDHDVVILDGQLSQDADVVIVDELQKRGVDCRIVLVFDEEPAASVLELGCTDYLVTPVDGEELNETVGRVIQIGKYVDRRRELPGTRCRDRAARIGRRRDRGRPRPRRRRPIPINAVARDTRACHPRASGPTPTASTTGGSCRSPLS